MFVLALCKRGCNSENLDTHLQIQISFHFPIFSNSILIVSFFRFLFYISGNYSLTQILDRFYFHFVVGILLSASLLFIPIWGSVFFFSFLVIVIFSWVSVLGFFLVGFVWRGRGEILNFCC